MNKKIYYAEAVYNNKEINAVIKVLKTQRLSLMDGKNVKIFESRISRLFGKKFGLMVNSGSSANLLALASLNLKPKSEIITPTLTFSTTVAPIYQLGFIPKFIDVEEGKFVANLDQLKKAITSKTKAIMIPNLLGNIPDWKEIRRICKKNNIIIIEDSADTLGYKINNIIQGNYTDVVTTSFYASHIVTGAGFGGMVCFNNEKFYNKAKLLRAWGRSSAIFNENENIEQRFKKNEFKFDYDKKYIFMDFGYNFIPSEVSAAFGLEQLKKLNKNHSIRRENFNLLSTFFKKYRNFFKLPIQEKFIKTAWLAFPLVIKQNNFFNRKQLQIFLEKNNIQTRTIFSGNILKQPLMNKKEYFKVKNCDIQSNDVMRNGLLIGCHHGLNKKNLIYMTKTFDNFFKSKKL
jgi:CDP-4-dehydro-6-deoxyglucose reductase, E1